MKILVTGYSGHVATALRRAMLEPGEHLIAPGRAVLDLSDIASVRRAVRDISPDIVINAGAWTDVEAAEDQPEAARVLNADAPEALAEETRRLGASLIHLSTDYVFDGEKRAPYLETDPARPLNAYGVGKLDGEQRVMVANPSAIVARVAWVFSPWSKSFVETMLRFASQREEVSVVDDQTGTPTSATEIASGLLSVARTLRAQRGNPGLAGALHMVSPDSVVRADFAEELFEISARLGGPSANVKRVASTEFPSKAIRPLDTRLDCVRLRVVFGVQLAPWRTALEPVVAEMLRRKAETGAFIGTG
jgi:dTDP-4-dehydrorhamnose reductase